MLNLVGLALFLFRQCQLQRALAGTGHGLVV
jgi:hypothetical protein